MFKNLFKRKPKEIKSEDKTSIIVLDEDVKKEFSEVIHSTTVIADSQINNDALAFTPEENINNLYDPIFLKKNEQEKTGTLKATSSGLTSKIENVTTILKENFADATEKTIQNISVISDNITEKTKQQLQKHGDDSVKDVNKTLIFTVVLCIIFSISTLGAVIMYADGQQAIKASESKMKAIEEKEQKTKTQNIRLNRMIDQLQVRLNDCMISQYGNHSATPSNSTNKLKNNVLETLPFDIGFRSSWLGNGQVLALKNNSDKHLAISLKVKNQVGSKNGDFSINLAPKTKKDWGHLEGWAFNKGDEISLEVSGYKKKTQIVP